MKPMQLHCGFILAGAGGKKFTRVSVASIGEGSKLEGEKHVSDHSKAMLSDSILIN